MLQLSLFFFPPEMCDNSNTHAKSKPMDDADFERVERDLRRQMETASLSSAASLAGMGHAGAGYRMGQTQMPAMSEYIALTIICSKISHIFFHQISWGCDSSITHHIHV